MMRKITGLFRRLFISRGFRRGTRILFGVSIAVNIYNLVMILIAFMRTSIPFRDVLRFFLSLSPFEFDFAWPFFIHIFLAIALGLICYFQGKEENGNTEEDTVEDKSTELPDPVQEEEPSEPKYYQNH